ncbi:glycosyltransferase family 2 protein [Peribacillus sp. SCS-26]|uniref:glycosyltransferase family 2 protein n=1 Tax=Paraperibacillus marinus TaxID=3115295 RepID=UPI0039062E03
MVDLTVVILTKNEEKNLRKCVESFKGIAKRFVIVDSFSTDNTEKLCIQLNRELKLNGGQLDFYQNKWSNHAAQFNWGLDNANITTEWVMRMDADEELMENLVGEIVSKIPYLKADINGVVLRRRVYFMGKWIRYGGRYPEMLLRIFRNKKAVCEEKIMDEHIILLEGEMVEFKNDFIDYNTKDLEWWTNKHNWYSNLEVMDYQMTLSNSLNELDYANMGKSSKQAKVKRKVKNKGYYRLPKFFRANLYFLYRYYIKLGFLDGPEGRIFHFLQAYWYRFLVDAKMYEYEKYNKELKDQGDLKY